jgi:hypothetical protein
MVRVFTSSAVDRVFEPRSGQRKDYKIGICCFSAKQAALRRKSRIMCPDSLKAHLSPVSKPRHINSIFTVNTPILYMYP